MSVMNHCCANTKESKLRSGGDGSNEISVALRGAASRVCCPCTLRHLTGTTSKPDHTGRLCHSVFVPFQGDVVSAKRLLVRAVHSHPTSLQLWNVLASVCAN